MKKIWLIENVLMFDSFTSSAVCVYDWWRIKIQEIKISAALNFLHFLYRWQIEESNENTTPEGDTWIQKRCLRQKKTKKYLRMKKRRRTRRRWRRQLGKTRRFQSCWWWSRRRFPWERVRPGQHPAAFFFSERPNGFSHWTIRPIWIKLLVWGGDIVLL